MKIHKSTVQIGFDLTSFSETDSLTLSMEKLDKEIVEKGDLAISDIYQFEFIQAGQLITSFDTPVLLSFKLERENDQAKIYHFQNSEEEWRKIGGELSDDWLVTHTDHFSIFAAFTPEDMMKQVELEEDNDQPGSSSDENTSDSNKTKKEAAETSTEKSSANGNSLPDTATNMYTFLLIGGLLIIIGMVVVVVRKSRKITNG